jgi:tetratricopeptide (TPR) repeat protein
MNNSPRATLRWRIVLRCVWPFAFLLTLAAGLVAIDPWLAQFPRESGRRWTEAFLRSLLMGYLGVSVVVPLLLLTSVIGLLRARRRGRRRPWLARLGLLCGALGLCVLALELTAKAWLAWEHRMPHLPTTFAQPATPDDPLSLVVIGGSSALGYPYNPTVSVGQIVAWQIEEAIPGRRVLLDIRANLGKNLEEMHTGLVDLKHKPDALIIYSGHNEFLSRFEDSRDAGYSEAPEGAFLNHLYQLSLHSPFCIWVYETVRKHRLGGPPPRVNHHRLIDTPAFTPSEYRQILADFRVRLDTLVEYCERIGAVPILVIPPGNESGYQPNRSVISARVSAAEREELADRFLQYLSVENQDPHQSMAGYRSILEAEPDFAEAHFRLGRLLESAKAYDEARSHYIQARDLDGYPVRCMTPFMEIYREVAARHACILVDGPRVLRAKSRHGILNDELLHDAHHPVFRSHFALAEAIMDQLFERKSLGLTRDATSGTAIDIARCAEHFHIDSKVWSMACTRAGAYYSHLAAARYDPSERRAKERRFMQAARDLQAGIRTAEELDVPGIGLSTSRAYPWDWWVGSQDADARQTALH